jgi:hypothetical protein
LIGSLIQNKILGENNKENEPVHMKKRQEKKHEQLQEGCGL